MACFTNQMSKHASNYSQMVPPYMASYRCCIQALANVQDLVEQGRQTIEATGGRDTYVELEIRFGKHTPVNFHPGITESAFSHIESRLDSSTDFSQVTDWHNVWVYHHANIERTATMRTETTYPPGTDLKASGPAKVESTYKRVIDKRNYQTRLLIANDIDLQSADMRIALSIERKPSLDEIPAHTIPTSVHLKRRKTYLLCPNQHPEPVWQYTLTQRWVGADREAAENSYKFQPPVCEVEIECIQPSYLCTQGSQYAAASMLIKACDILKMINSALDNREAFVIEPQCLLWQRKV
jgi:hypothetical protein